ncbi:hypothetical protein [Methylobacterium durans]|uniref:O-antigen ligase domain-containing protein n=1 Tax=Methylobacterium durans TaxID=2202825 RepID=A0A2U8W7Q8_9HYPH|nr:hypothetical protein [Methylobacterium durans]AWN41412.1 hypothetical protein DK389_13920 [Methylobacterium durans]
MSLEPIGLAVLLAGFVCLLAGPAFSVYALLVAALLQSAAAIVLTSLGGASIQPAHLLLLFFLVGMLRYATTFRGMIEAARPPNPGFWLVVLLIYALISAAFLPRLFEGMTYAFGNSREGGGTDTPLLPLAPNSGNITQPVYFAGNVVCFLVVAAYARGARRANAVANAVLFCCGANLIFAALDQLTALTNTTELMQPLRNASYRMLDEGQVMGLKRLVGSFPEASAYASTTLGLFGFSFSLWLRHHRSRLSGLLATSLLVSLMLSTSSTAYAGTIIYLTLVYVGCLLRMGQGSATLNMSRFVFVAPLAAVFLFILLQFSDAAWRTVSEVLDSFLFNKLASASGVERARWNQQAIVNFIDTYGLGTGLGSVKSSSFLTSALGNVGLVGLIAFTAFFAAMLRRAGSGQIDPRIAPLREAAASGCIALLVAAALSGGSIDLGLQFCALGGLACADPGTQALTLVPNRARMESLGIIDSRGRAPTGGTSCA